MSAEEAALAHKVDRNVAAFRVRAGLTVFDLAASVQISPAHLNEIERGNDIPRGELIFALVAVLSIDLNALMAGIKWQDGAFYIDGDRVSLPED